jgi:hypothetical protein
MWLTKHHPNSSVIPSCIQTYHSLFLLPQRPGVPGVGRCGKPLRVYVRLQLSQDLRIFRQLAPLTPQV